MKLFSRIVFALGILGILLGIAVAGISAALVPLTDGRTSWDEAMLGIIPGIIVLVLSFFVVLLGVVLMIVAKKKQS